MRVTFRALTLALACCALLWVVVRVVGTRNVGCVVYMLFVLSLLSRLFILLCFGVGLVYFVSSDLIVFVLAGFGLVVPGGSMCFGWLLFLLLGTPYSVVN